MPSPDLDALPDHAEAREVALMRLMREAGMVRDEVILLRLASLTDAVQHWRGLWLAAREEAESRQAALWLAEARLAAWEALEGTGGVRNGAAQDRAGEPVAPF